MHKREQERTRTRMFTASEVAEFEYCPLTWWHEQFEPWAHAENDELFARLVELEHEHATQAPALPEYQMIEQLLLRRGAFDEGQQQHQAHAGAVENIEAEIEAEICQDSSGSLLYERAARAMIVLASLALVLILAGLLLH